MCILIVKESNKIIPSKNILARCYKTNPDGAGFCYNKDNTIVIKKGYMTFDEFYNAVQEIPTESSALIHCRIGTSGGKTPAMTHPYPLTNDYESMKKTNQILKNKSSNCYAVAHNGVFSGVGIKFKEDINDTCMFIANILNPLKEAVNNIQDKAIEPIINRLVGTSKLAILDKYGNITRYGDGWVEDNGIFYSNNTFKEITYTYYTNSNAYSYGYKGCKTYNDYIYEQYGNYANYEKHLRKEEAKKIAKLIKNYPNDAKKIQNYAKQGFSSWQIKNFVTGTGYYNDDWY